MNAQYIPPPPTEILIFGKWCASLFLAAVLAFIAACGSDSSSSSSGSGMMDSGDMADACTHSGTSTLSGSGANPITFSVSPSMLCEPQGTEMETVPLTLTLEAQTAITSDELLVNLDHIATDNTGSYTFPDVLTTTGMHELLISFNASTDATALALSSSDSTFGSATLDTITVNIELNGDNMAGSDKEIMFRISFLGTVDGQPPADETMVTLLTIIDAGVTP